MNKELFKIFNDRFSCRYFKEGIVIPDEDIEKMVSWAYLWPSSYDLWPYELIVINNKNIINLISNSIEEHKFIKNASSLIVVCQKNIKYENIDEYLRNDLLIANEWHIDASIAWTYIDLIATSMWYNTIWMGYYENKYGRRILNIPKDYKLLYYIAIWKKWHENIKRKNNKTNYKGKVHKFKFWKSYYVDK